MTVRRFELTASLLLLLAAACTVLPPPRSPARAETRRVAIPGEEADTLAETTGPSEEGLVPLRAHDGRELWARETALGNASLVPGTWVLVRSAATLVPAPVLRSLDDFVEVELGGAPTLISTADVLARLHHGPAIAPPVVPPVVPPTLEPPPPTPLDEMVLLESAPRSIVATLVACTEGAAQIALADGTTRHVARASLHPLRGLAGRSVTALWNGSPYPATVIATRADLVRVRWEDASEQWVERTEIVSVEAAGQGHVAGCPHDAVLVDEGVRARVGRLLACEGDRATVLDADGATRTIDRAALARAPVHVGDAIEARWNGSPYDAVVTALGPRLHVRWYDASEGDVDPADVVIVRLPEARASEAPRCPGT